MENVALKIVYKRKAEMTYNIKKRKENNKDMDYNNSRRFSLTGRMVRVREKVFRNSSWFTCNVSFVEWTSMFVNSVLEASLSFTNI